MNDKVTKAEVGAEVIGENREIVVVQPACADKTGGAWFCVTHQAWLNQFAKDTHISDGKPHVMAWDCGAHGLERP